jgi:1-aminocyclopropane-1-carboxylate deaminase/D-cysteine desulfhydrase-like pyridoxal-dependent ACC family enzyme
LHTIPLIGTLISVREKTGEESYLIPVGGSNTVGMFGFLTVFEEMQPSVSVSYL